MLDEMEKKYQPKKKNTDFKEFVKRNGLYFRDAEKYKRDAGVLELCELLEGKKTDTNNNLFAMRLMCLYDLNGEAIPRKFLDALDTYTSMLANTDTYGSFPLSHLDRVLTVFNLIDKKGQLTERGYQFIKTLSETKR